MKQTAKNEGFQRTEHQLNGGFIRFYCQSNLNWASPCTNKKNEIPGRVEVGVDFLPFS